MAMDRREKQKQEQRKKSALEWADQQAQGYEPTAVKRPSDMKRFPLEEEGMVKFDVIPFLAGFGNRRADPGFEWWEREYAAHRLPMPSGKESIYCCLYETWGKPCPVCKKANQKNLDKEIADKIRAKKRILMLVNDKPGELDNPVKLLDEAHYNRKLGFGQQLVTSMRMSAQTMGEDVIGQFYDAEEGLTLIVNVENGTYHQVSRIDFAKRRYQYPKDIASKMPCVDDFLIPACPKSLKDTPLSEYEDEDWEACYKELERIMEGGDEEETSSQKEGDEKEPPFERKEPEKESGKESGKEPAKQSGNGHSNAKPNTKPSVKPEGKDIKCEYEEGDSVWYKGMECMVRRISSDGKSLSLLDEEDNAYKGVAVGDVRKEAPKAVAGKASQKGEEEDEFEDEFEEDE